MIKSITDQLAEASGGILEVKPEVRDETGYYTMADDGGVEHPVGSFLYGLVKILQPQLILETGTYSGISSLYMAQALKENSHGELITVEHEMFHKQRAERLWEKCGVNQYVTCINQSSLDFQPNQQYDLLFLDSEPQIRYQELVNFFPHLKEGGYIGIHDLHGHMGQNSNNPDHPDEPHWPWGEIPQQIKDWVREDKLRVVHFPNPRGFTLLYKTKEGDHKW